SAEASCRDLCDGYIAQPSVGIAAYYKAGIARSITACILAKPSCGTLTHAQLEPCADDALAHACDDPTATTFCAPMVESCGGITPPDGGSNTIFTKEGCESIAKGLTSEGRKAFTSCVMEG